VPYAEGLRQYQCVTHVHVVRSAEQRDDAVVGHVFRDLLDARHVHLLSRAVGDSAESIRAGQRHRRQTDTKFTCHLPGIHRRGVHFVILGV